MKYEKFRKLPYLETKVVKVEKKKCEHIGRFDPYNNTNTVKCIYCGKTFVPIKPKKGNWVNGENLDKIKFPCYCSFKTNINDYKGYGELDFYAEIGLYVLKELKQKRSILYTFECKSYSLKYLIQNFDIHILKGKIILFEE